MTHKHSTVLPLSATPMADRTQLQIDTTPDVKKQIKLLMLHEDIYNQGHLFLSALVSVYGDKYPDLKTAILDQLENKPTLEHALLDLLKRK